MTSDDNRLEINWVNSAGAALGAVSAAVLLSTLGAAGTLIGAALGSLCISVGGAVYAHSLKIARRRVAAAQALAAHRRSRTRASGAVDVADRDTQALVTPEEVGEAVPDQSRWQVLRELPWKRILVISAALFAVAMAAILTFELATGRPVSTYTGGTSDTDRGTSVPGIGGRGDESAPEEQDQAPQQQPEQDEAEQDDQPAPAPAEPTPTDAETVEPAPSEAPVPPQETAP